MVAMPSEAAKVVLHNAGSLIRVPELAGRVVDALARVQAAGGNDEELVECVSAILETCKPDKKTTERLNAILDGIAGTTFHSRLRRYVGMPEHIDMISESRRENREKELDALAGEAADLNTLRPELGWLVTGGAVQGYRLGYDLAGKDPKWRSLPDIMGALKDAGDGGAGSFVGGYLRRVREKDAARWGAELDAVYGNERTRRLLPALVQQSGVTDESARKIMRGVRSGGLGCDAMRSVMDSNHVSVAVFAECVDLLAGHGDGAAAFMALELVYFRLRQGKGLPRDTAMRALLHDNVMNRTEEHVKTGRGEWEWEEIGSWFVRQYPDDGIRVLEAVVNGMDAATSLVAEDGKGPVMEEIVRARPAEAWSVLSRHTGPPTDRKACKLQKWLAGSAFDRGDGAMSSIPISEINAWVGEDDGARAAHVASFLPNNFGYIRGFLSRYGDRQDVQEALAANFSNEGWHGSEVTHHQEKKKGVEGQMEGEKDPRILSWLRFYARRIDDSIRRSSDREERGL